VKDLAEGKVPKKKKIFTNMTGSAVTGSFTSTSMAVATENVMLEATEYQVKEMRWAAVRKLGQKGTHYTVLILYSLHCTVLILYSLHCTVLIRCTHYTVLTILYSLYCTRTVPTIQKATCG
jgi:hypothetical protein